MISNYLVVAGKYLFFEKDSISSVPINYEILNNSSEDFSLKEIESDSIILSNEMLGIFEKYNFTIESFVDNSYENLIVFSSLPDDFLLIEPTRLKKNLFIKTILPIVFLENERVLAERKKILEWWTETEGEFVSREFWPDWLERLGNEYNYEGENIGDLLMRVDIIPISMAISQAVVESGWGTSRYSREANAIFGQYTFDESSGILPEKREENKKHFIKKFLSISESVSSYIKNLNTHFAYEELRKKRRELRMDGKTLTGEELINYLSKYSERGKDYLADLQSLLLENDFARFDKLNSSNLVEN